MKIGLLVPDVSHHNGWAHYSLSLLRALQAQGIATTIIAAHNSPDVPGMSLHRLLPNLTPPENKSLLKMLRVLPQVRHLLSDCDALHATAEPYAPLAALVAGSRPVFVTAHGSYINLPRIRRFPVNRLYAWAFSRSRLICVSHYTAQIAAQIVPDAQTIVIPNAADVTRFITPTAHDGQPNLMPPKKNTPNLILSSGGVKARKGTLQLIRAIAKVRANVPDIQCVVTGSLTAEAAYVAQVRTEIERLHLVDCVQLTGFLPEAELIQWYQQATVFVLPAINSGWKFEGFGLAYLEAGAVGLPVIGTTDCGAQEAIQPGITGLLVDQKHIETQLPEAILQMLLHPEQAQQMGAAGRHHAQTYTPFHVAQQVIAAYQVAVDESLG